MGVWQTFREWFGSDGAREGFGPLTEVQGEALVEALVIAAFANGHMSEDQYSELIDHAMEVPVLRRRGRARVRELADRMKRRLAGRDADSAVDLVEPVASQLAGAASPEAALRLIAGICLVDRIVDPYELRVLRRFAEVWGVDPARMQQIVAEVEAEG